MCDDGLLLRVLNVLEISLSSNSASIQRVHEELNTLSQHQHFDYCLISIFSNIKYKPSLRHIAGLTLKNRIRYFEKSSTYRPLIKQQCLLYLEDESADIRNTCGILISSLIKEENDILDWPELFPHLNDTLISNRKDYSAESIVMALQKIFEDHAMLILSGSFSEKFFSTIDCLLGNLIQLITHPNLKLKTCAISTLNNIIIFDSPLVSKNLGNFVEKIFQISNSDQAEVIQQICRALVTISENKFELLISNIQQIIDYMIVQTNSNHYTVALEACEFWQIIVNNASLCKILQNSLNRLIPILIDQMKYNEIDLAMLNFEIEEKDKKDRLEDLKPVLAKSNPNHSNQNIKDSNDGGEDIDGEDEDEDFNICDIDDYGSSWTLRKSASLSLDLLSESFKEEVVICVMHKLNSLFNHPNWIIRESGVLVLGAISKGCYNFVTVHLSNVFHILMQFLNDEHALVRSITLWTISRYSKWLSLPENDNLLSIITDEICKRMIDTNRRVQETACCSFSTIAERLKFKLQKNANSIMSTFYEAAKKYNTKNWRVLCETVATFILHVVPNEFNQNEEFMKQIMSIFMFYWNSIDDSHTNIIVLFDSIGAVITICNKQTFYPFIQIFVNRSLSIIDQFVIQSQLSWEDPERSLSPDPNFIISSMDLLGRIFECFQSDAAFFFQNKNFLNFLKIILKVFESDVRRYAYNLLSDITYNCYSLISNSIDEFCSIILNEIIRNEKSFCTSNAIFSLSIIIIQSGSNLKSQILNFIDPLIVLINEQNNQSGLCDNCAITIGYLSYCYPDLMAEYLKYFIKSWCISMRDYRDSKEKEISFTGICQVVSMNSEPIAQDFIRFLDAIGSWFHPTDHLLKTFSQTIELIRLKYMDDIKWNSFWQNMPRPLFNRLQDLFSSSSSSSHLLSSTQTTSSNNLSENGQPTVS